MSEKSTKGGDALHAAAIRVADAWIALVKAKKNIHSSRRGETTKAWQELSLRVTELYGVLAKAKGVPVSAPTYDQPTMPLRDHLIGLTTGACVRCGEATYRIQSHPDMKCTTAANISRMMTAIGENDDDYDPRG